MSVVQQWSDARVQRLRSDAGATLVDEQLFHRLDNARVCGGLRVYEGRARVVESRLTLHDLSVDSVMVHAFAPSASTSPHLVSDLAHMPDGRWHFHVDLLPRVDLMTSSHYLDTVFPPLDPAFVAATALPGSAAMPIPRRLRALGSAWMVGVIADPTDEPVLTSTHDAYASRFFELLRTPPAAPPDDSLVRRDSDHRRALFDTATDPVWEILEGIIGAGSVDALLQAVRAPWR